MPGNFKAKQPKPKTQNTKPNKSEKLGEAPKIEPNFEIDNVQDEKQRAVKQVRSMIMAGDTTARYSTKDCLSALQGKGEV